MSNLNEFLRPFASAAEINTGTEAAKAIAPDQARLAGQLVQVKHATLTAVATGTTVMPLDDSIPQKTEGDEYLTLAITPKNAANILLVMAVVMIGHTGAGTSLTIALFQDAVAGALAATSTLNTTATGWVSTPLNYRMVAGGVSEITFKIRAGSQTGATTTINGQSGGRFYGGLAPTTLTVFEFTP